MLFTQEYTDLCPSFPTLFPWMRMETFWVEIQSCRISCLIPFHLFRWIWSLMWIRDKNVCDETRIFVTRKVYQWGISFPCSCFNWLLDKFSLRGGKEFLIFSMSSFRLLLPSQILTPLGFLDSQPSESDWTSETWTRIVEVSSLESPKRVLSQVALFSLSPSFLPTFALTLSISANLLQSLIELLLLFLLLHLMLPGVSGGQNWKTRNEVNRREAAPSPSTCLFQSSLCIFYHYFFLSFSLLRSFSVNSSQSLFSLNSLASISFTRISPPLSPLLPFHLISSPFSSLRSTHRPHFPFPPSNFTLFFLDQNLQLGWEYMLCDTMWNQVKCGWF